jgi:hypothetical protein
MKNLTKDWIEKKLADENRKQEVFKKIESKLSKEEKEILETLLKQGQR